MGLRTDAPAPPEPTSDNQAEQISPVPLAHRLRMAAVRAATANGHIAPQEPQGGGPVNKAMLLKKLETMLDEYERGRRGAQSR